MTRVVRRELDRRIVVDPHQVADRVAVLDPIESPHRHSARVGIRGVDPERPILDPVFQEPQLCVGRPRFAGGRHDASPHVLEHGQPELAITRPRLARCEPVEGDAAFFQAVAVARITVVLEDRPDLAVERFFDPPGRA